MLLVSLAGCLLLVCTLVHGTQIHQRKYALHESRHALPPKWSWKGHAPLDAEIPVRIGLTQRNLDVAPKLLQEVSDPSSEKYGKYYTQDQVVDLFAPSNESISKVKLWLHDEGIPEKNISLSANKQWIQFDTSIATLNQLLQAKYSFYEHEITRRRHLSTEGYSVPSNLQDVIDLIKPGVVLQSDFKHKSHTYNAAIPRDPLPPDFPEIMRKPLSERCAKIITPECIRALYKFPEGNLATKGNELGVYETDEEYYQQADLDRFFTKFFPKIPNGTHPHLEGIDGGSEKPYRKGLAGGEADLDFEVAYPIIWPQQATVMQVPDGADGIFNTWLDALDGSYCTYKAFGIKGNSPGVDPKYPARYPVPYHGKLQCGKYKPNNVMTVSFGEQGEYYFPLNYTRRQCSEFMKLGMQGVTVLSASGDSGVASADYECLSNPRTGAENIFNPGNLQSCPYITVVGATHFPSGANIHKNGEIAVAQPYFRSGSGFSNIFAQPEFQASSVEDYFKKVKLPFKSYRSHLNESFAKNGGLFNRAGRGYPDVAAIGQNIVIADSADIHRHKKFVLSGGTSASSPIFASLLNRINEERLNAGKSTVGFVNPMLYAHPEVFNDITKGNSAACGTKGFPATKGWDPVTGLGTPIYPKMLEIFMRLP